VGARPQRLQVRRPMPGATPLGPLSGKPSSATDSCCTILRFEGESRCAEQDGWATRCAPRGRRALRAHHPRLEAGGGGVLKMMVTGAEGQAQRVRLRALCSRTAWVLVELDLPTSAAWNRLHAPGMPGEGLSVCICRGLAVRIVKPSAQSHGPPFLVLSMEFYFKKFLEKGRLWGAAGWVFGSITSSLTGSKIHK
jgi:hypothetical protein